MNRKILFTMEVPTNHLDAVNPLIDGMFCIATECLKDQDYLKWHIANPPMFLDNGAYEEGHPMPANDLVDVALRVKPQIVFAPDMIHDSQSTIVATADFIRRMHNQNPKQGIGFIPQGRDEKEIVDCLEYWLESGMISEGKDCIGLSFLNNRPAVISEIERRGLSDVLAPHWVHALGLYGTYEIKHWPDYIKSMDTVKPFKAAYHGYAVEDCPRGLGKWNTYMTLSNELAHGTLFRNISYMHKALTVGGSL